MLAAIGPAAHWVENHPRVLEAMEPDKRARSGGAGPGDAPLAEPSETGATS